MKRRRGIPRGSHAGMTLLVLLVSASTWAAGPVIGPTGGGGGGGTIAGYMHTPQPRIAFTNRPSAADHIYAMDAKGGKVAQLTSNSGDQGPVAWSFDGTKIAWTINSNIYRANADGSGQFQLTSSGKYSFPSWSKDGTLIYAARNTNSTTPALGPIVSMSAVDGNGEVTVVGSDTLSFSADPHVSPDGTKLVFESNIYDNHVHSGAPFEIYTCTLSNCTGTYIKITHINDSGIVGQAADPNWSPDGTKIAISYCPSGSCTSNAPLNVATMNADGTGLVQVTNFACPQEANDPAYSPSGQLAFEWDGGKSGNCVYASDNTTPTTHIYTMNADGSGQSDTGQACSNIGCGPRYRPGGVTLAASCTSPGCTDNYRVANSSNPGTLTITTPASSGMADGQALYVEVDDSGTAPSAINWTAGTGVTLDYANLGNGSATPACGAPPATGAVVYRWIWNATAGTLSLLGCPSKPGAATLPASLGGMIGATFGVGFDFIGTPGASQIVVFTAPYTMNVPANYATPTSVCTCQTSPSGDQSYSIKVNNVAQGTFTVKAACGNTASPSNVTLPTTSAYQISAGQEIMIQAPAVPTGADIACTIAFTR